MGCIIKVVNYCEEKEGGKTNFNQLMSQYIDFTTKYVQFQKYVEKRRMDMDTSENTPVVKLSDD
ncbi:hypothetical protein C5167_024974 [Papaver somniferum]|uniref:Uncharacterized protein n=1 Tax=Papaver somniferum TaxID=3469 RepID=A0A4Y7JTD5_PAPSO|nr:hypothetical protein C5167_024974 [Papaver somniferum]